MKKKNLKEHVWPVDRCQKLRRIINGKAYFAKSQLITEISQNRHEFSTYKAHGMPLNGKRTTSRLIIMEFRG